MMLIRPNDVNIDSGVADTLYEKNYYLFHSKTLNTFSEYGVQNAKEHFNLEQNIVVTISFILLGNFSNNICHIRFPKLIF
jgi:hypothetical protein